MGKHVAKNDFQEIVIFKNHKDKVIGVYGYEFGLNNVFQCDNSFPHYDLGEASIKQTNLSYMMMQNYNHEIKLMDGTE